MAVEATTGLTGEMMTYLESLFLERSQALNVHAEGSFKKVHTQNSGKTITWNRYTPLSAATTALTEGANGTESNISAATVSATVAEYGNYDKISSLLYGTSIDKAAKEKTELLSQNANETLDTLARNELFSGATVQYANGRASLATVTATDTLTVTEVRKAVRTLKKNNATAYDDGFFIAKVGPDTSFDLMADSTWVNAHSYKDGSELYKGELGKLHRVRFLECSSNQRSESSTTTVYSNFFHGKQAFGEVDLEGSGLKLIIKNSDNSDTSNPLNMFMTIGWKATYAVKTLNANWLINVKTGATA